MKSFLTALASTLCLADARLVCRGNSATYPPTSLQSNTTRYAILDNDWGSTSFIPYLLALGAGLEVLGLASDTGDTWVDQTTLHGVSIPIYPTQIFKGLIKKLACNTRERQFILHSSGQRRDISPDTDISTFPALATTLGELRVARSIYPGKSDRSVFG